MLAGRQKDSISSRRPGILIVLFSLVAAVTTPNASSATASDPGSTDDEPAVHDTAEPAPERTTREEVEQVPLEEGEVEAIAEFYGISREAAEHRLRVEIATVGLDGRLQDRWPDTYAGSSHTDDGSPGVIVAFQGPVDDVEQRRAEIAEEFAYPEFVEIREGAAVSLAKLEQAYFALAGDIERLARGGDHPREALRQTRGRFGVGLNLVENRLDVTLPQSTRTAMGRQDGRSGAERLRSAIVEHYGVPNVEVEPVGELRPETHECSRGNCQWEMMGGLQLLRDELCTSGFGGIKGTQRYVISAGHCSGGVGTWRRNGTDGHYGTVEDEQLTGDVDAEIIRHETNPWATHGVIALFESGEDFREITGFVTASGYSTTWTIGMSGASSNQVSRGKITNLSWSGTDEDGKFHSDFVRANYCAQGGDSGAPIFRNNDALGIHFGGFANSCDRLFTKIQHVGTRFGISLLAGWAGGTQPHPEPPPPPPPPPPPDECTVRDPVLDICVVP